MAQKANSCFGKSMAVDIIFEVDINWSAPGEYIVDIARIVERFFVK